MSENNNKLEQNKSEPVIVEIKKSTLVSIEVLITVVTLTFAIAVTYVRSEYNAQKHSEQIASLQTTFGTEMQKIGPEMQRIRNSMLAIEEDNRRRVLIEQVKMRDRWTATMEAEKQNDMYSVLCKYIPELTPDAMPDVRAIQREFIVDLINGENNNTYKAHER